MSPFFTLLHACIDAMISRVAESETHLREAQKALHDSKHRSLTNHSVQHLNRQAKMAQQEFDRTIRIARQLMPKTAHDCDQIEIEPLLRQMLAGEGVDLAAGSSLPEIFSNWAHQQRDAGCARYILMKHLNADSENWTDQQIGDELGITRWHIQHICHEYKKELGEKCSVIMRFKIETHLLTRTSPLCVESLIAGDSWFSGFESLAPDGVVNSLAFTANLIAFVLGDFTPEVINDRLYLNRRTR